MEFLLLSRRRSSSRKVPSGEERGEWKVFAGYHKLGSISKNEIVHFQVRGTYHLYGETEIPGGK